MRGMPARAFTADELLRLPRNRGRHELVHGELRTMSPAGWQHGIVAAACTRLLANHVVEHGLGVADAIDFPRVHVDEPHVHCEGGFDEAELARVEAAGYDVVRWRRRNLYFGGVAGVEVGTGGTLAAAGDPRRGGHGIVVE